MNYLTKALVLMVAPIALVAPNAAAAGTVNISPVDASEVEQAPVAEIADAVPASEHGADVFLKAAPGQKLTVRVTPKGCEEKGCEYKITTSTPADTAAPKAAAPPEPESLVAATGSTAVTVLSADPLPATELLATRAITVYTWNTVNDQVCSGYGCFAWQMNLGTKAYLDYTYAWGNRSRYGYAGSYTCTKGGSGYSVSRQACGYRNDPSRTGLYAEFQANVAGAFKGFPINKDWYIHRHYSGNGSSWVVINY